MTLFHARPVLQDRPLITLELVHDSGERRTVDVLGIAGYGLSVRWGNLAGVYTLLLKTNCLGKYSRWHAADLARAREIWRKFGGRAYEGKPTLRKATSDKPTAESRTVDMFGKGKTG